MNKNVIGTCPVCGENLTVSVLTCDGCNTSIHGSFNLSKFDYLSTAQQEFAFVFIKNGGNIKLIEKELNISYPTVKKNLDDLINALGFEKINETLVDKPSKEDIYKALKNGEITFDEAEEMLKEV
ncbi:MAG: DUF2089 domain-containing protein [Erysipelotrichaceae bacterium]|nr:DUF2089 domain-containing protein [Erysipelotrichaceae bacterium]